LTVETTLSEDMAFSVLSDVEKAFSKGIKIEK
jgi:hypothetical protein